MMVADPLRYPHVPVTPPSEHAPPTEVAVLPVAIATTGAEHEPDAFITQNDGYPRAAHDENADDAAVAVEINGAIQDPVAVIVQVAGKPIELHD